MKKRILCIDVNSGNETDLINQIKEDINLGRRGYSCFSNVHMLVEAYDNFEFAEVVNSATYVFPDGYPIAASFRILYGNRQERIAGMDFLPTFLEKCSEENYKVAFVGSTEDVLEKTREKISRELPGLELTQLISPPFGKPWNNEKYLEQLNQSGTQVVFVALGCPKQERWMSENYSKTNAFMFGIGGALPTYAGVVRRAPGWMQYIGMEWFFRLYKEPKRMFRRYLYTNSKFIYLLIKELINPKRNTQGKSRTEI